MRRCLAVAMSLLALSVLSANADQPIAFAPEIRANAAKAVQAAFRKGAEEIMIGFKQDLSPEALLEDQDFGPWIARIERTADRTAALCEISLRRGLTPGQDIQQLAISSTQTTGDTDPYAPAAAYDAFLFFGETRLKKRKAVRLIFTRRDAHGALDCDGAFAILRAAT